MRRWRRRRGQGDRGASLVEFALVLPVLMVLMLGMVTSASAWNKSESMNHGGQVAARFGSTTPWPTAAADQDLWLDGVIDKAIATSSGAMAAAAPGRAICVAYVDPAGANPDKTVSRRMNSAGVRTSATTECYSDSLPTTAKRVQVVMQRQSTLEIGFLQRTLNLRRTIVYRFEADGGL
jgi:Flp pilus assembly protein TadG